MIKLEKKEIEAIGLIIGPLFALIFYYLGIVESPLANAMAGVTILMAIWWMTEAVPLSVTSMLPLILFPFLEIHSANETANQYINSTIFLFLGGFLLAQAMERWELHKRISLYIIRFLGGDAKGILRGFFLSSWLLSMFITNTATTIMMLPIGIAVIKGLEGKFSDKAVHNFGVALLLGIAYSSSIGGIATLVGTVPNIAFKSIFEMTFPAAPEISFVKWMSFALPMSVVLMVVVWFVLNNFLFKIDDEISVDKQYINKEIKKLGKISIQETIILYTMVSASLLWIFRVNVDLGFMTIPGWSNILPDPSLVDDSTVAIGLSILLFIIPATLSNLGTDFRLMTKDTIINIPWDILLLFGGGFAMAKGFQTTGLSEIIGNGFAGMQNVPPLLISFFICFVVIFLTEFTSNTATTYTFLPILASISVAIDVNPMILMIPATISASLAFMLPVATPPNAIVFGSGKIKIAEMANTGLWINIIAAILVPLLFALISNYILDIDMGVNPSWAE